MPVTRKSRSARYNPYSNSRKYRKYYYKQPKSMAYVEEPTDESEVSDESDVPEESDVEVQQDSDSEDNDEEVYTFKLRNNNADVGDVYDIYEVESDIDSDGNIFYYPNDSDDSVIDLNDELHNDAVEYLVDNGEIEDVNDQLVRYYDSDSESDSEDSDYSVSEDSEFDPCTDSDCQECQILSDSDSECDDSECDACGDECDSECDSECGAECGSECDSDDSAEDILDVVDLNDQLQAQALSKYGAFEPVDQELSDEELIDDDALIEEMSDDELFDEVFGDFIDEDDDDISVLDDSDVSSTTEEIDYSSDIEELKDQLQLENVRQCFEEDLDDETSSDEDNEILGDEPEYFEIEDEDFSDSDESSDDEGVTIYRSNYYVPSDDSDSDMDYDELIDNNGRLLALDSEDEDCRVIDLSDELTNSKDFECQEFDDHYKINIRLPAINKDELKIDFLKNENELIVTGKFDFNVEEIEQSDCEESEEDEDDEEDEDFIEEDDKEEDEEKEDDDEEEDEEEEEEEDDDEKDENEGDEKESADEDEDDKTKDNESEKSDSEEDVVVDEKTETSESESEDEDYEETSDEDENEFSGFVDEEIEEDAEKLIKDFKNQEISFEKHFQFDKIVKFEEIQAKFVNDDELEIVVPREDVDVSENNTVSIAIAQNPVEEDEEVVFEDASMEQ